MIKKLHFKWLLLLAIMFAGTGNVSAADKWVKTAPADLATGDVVLIVDQTSGKAMSNNNGTSAPSAIAVTLNSDKSEISSNVETTLQWDVTVGGTSEAPTYQFSVTSGETTNYLTCSSTNNGVKVGDGERKSFTIVNGGTNDGYYLYNKSGTDERYIGCYSSSDWRCYTTINNNIKGNNNAFYKKTAVSGPVDPSVTISLETIATGGTATISGPEGLTISFESDDETIATVSNDGVVTGVAAGTATITASWDAVTDTYNAGSKEFTVTVVAATTYEKVTDATQLVAGNEYIIVAPDYNRAMGAQNGSIRGYVDVIISNDDKIAITSEEVAVLTLGGTTGAWTFLASDNSLYLALTSSSNALHTSEDPTADGSQWTVSSDFMLHNNAYTNRLVKYNSGSPRFACYTSGQQDAVLFVKSGSATDTRVEPGFSFSPTTVEATIGETFTAPTFSNPNSVAVTFESTNTDVAIINENGEVTILAAGTTTIKATSEPNDTYLAGLASYSLTVTDPNGPGTENNPYTVEQAIAATPTAGEVYICGVVSSFQGASIMDDDTNYRYYISDDGTTTTQLLVYKGKGLNQDAFSDPNDLKVGDEVTIYGKLIMYQNAPEVASGNYLVSWNRPVITTPTITVDPATVNVDADEHDGTLALTYENLTISDMTDFDIKYYDAEGEEVSGPDWIEVLVAEQDPQVGEGYVVSYYMFENEGDARTASFKVYALDDEANEVYSNLITITQAKYVAPEVTIGNFVKVTSTSDITSGQYLIVYEDGNVAFDGSRDDSDNKLDAVSNTINVTINNGTIAATTTNAQSVFTIDVTAGTLQSASGLYIGHTSDANGLASSNETIYTNTISFDNEGNANIVSSGAYLRYNSASNQLRFRYYKSSSYASQQAIQLYKFVADEEDATVTITSAGYATYCSEKNLDFSNTGLTAYKATITGTEVSFDEVKQVPAGQGVLLKGARGTYTVPVAANASALTSNDFIGVTEETPINETGIFVLMNIDGVVGFYKTTAASFTVGAHTAYLPALPSSARNFIAIDGEATAIKTIESKQQSGEIYNLAGQRVKSAQKGLYIINGKKVVIK